jgi:hypothetical protein
MIMGSVLLGPLSDSTSNCSPVLLSEWAPHRNKSATFRPQTADKNQDVLTDWLTISHILSTLEGRIEKLNCETLFLLLDEQRTFYELQWTPKFTDNQSITDTDICMFVSIFVNICIHSLCKYFTRFCAYPNYIQIKMFVKTTYIQRQEKRMEKKKRRKNSTD